MEVKVFISMNVAVKILEQSLQICCSSFFTIGFIHKDATLNKCVSKYCVLSNMLWQIRSCGGY